MVRTIVSLLKEPFTRLTAKTRVDYPPNVDVAHQSIFVHIPKNGGTSVARSLGYGVTSHHSAAEYRRIMGSKDFGAYFKFCFIRNPWARFLSLYNYARLEESDYHSSIAPEKAIYGKHGDYDLLRDADLKQCAHYLLEGKLCHDRAWNHWLPQGHWILGQRNEILVDFVGRLENMEQDFRVVCERLSISGSLTVHNPSRPGRRDPFYYRPYYDRETRMIVADYYRDDIERFDYRF